jgi:NAD(P)-dependent dehydrogenase (short-subunit alcohol dehydrogenase family)
LISIRELSNLKNRKALITGATGNLGKVIAETLAELGADLILVDKPGSNFDQIISELINTWNVKVEYYYCDLESQDQRTDLISEIFNSNKELNILINNAAMVGTYNNEGWAVPLGYQSIESWNKCFEINLTAAFDLSKNLLPLLKNSIGATIVNISSIYGFRGPDWSLYENTNMSNPAAYSVSKAGLISMTKWFSKTVSPEVRVNVISPGGIFRHQPKSFIKRYSQKTPLARMATEDDFRGAIAFLVSDLSSYVTGHNLIVDGGWSV